MRKRLSDSINKGNTNPMYLFIDNNLQFILNVAFVAMLAFVLFLMGCTPKVEVAVPDKPITINLNVKIDHEVRVKVEEDVEELFEEDEELF